MSHLSRSASELITAFTTARQEMELEADKGKLDDIVGKISARRETVRVKSGKDKKKKGASVSEALKNAEKYKNMDEHRIELPELYERLGVNPEKGLTDEEGMKRNKEYGDNLLSEKKKTPWYIKLLKELTTFFALLLWFGAILCFIAYALAPEDPSNLYLGIVLAVVVFLTGVLSYFQNSKSDAIMDAFKNFIPPMCKVLRGGKHLQLPAAKLVPGDIVEVKGGDRIPADIRIIFSQEMRVDNSSLTGESDALLRTVECTHKDNPLETSNLAFFGTLCKEGIATGIVIQIGDKTVIGQIANLASSAGHADSPLRHELDRFIIFIACIAFALGIFFFVAGFILGYDPITNVVFAIGIIVANVPEGLLACITVSLTMAAKRLAVKKVLVKNLEAVETLGSTSCICSDKTGTLTQNRMTAAHLWYDGKIVTAENFQKKGPTFKYEYDAKETGFKVLHDNAILCSEAVFDNSVPDARKTEITTKIHDEAEQKKALEKLAHEYEGELNNKLWLDRPVIGDASETALVKFFQPLRDVLEHRQSHSIRKMKDGSIAKIPFNSSWKYALNICEYKREGSVSTIYIKGAPEKIWSMCSHVSVGGKGEEIDNSWKKKFDEVNRVFGNGGERVLGFASYILPESQYGEDYQYSCKTITDANYPVKGFTFSGLVSLVDPPRDAVPYAILKCKTAGIKVIMVTGDQPVTAAAIARQVHIFDDNEKTVNEIAEEQGISIDEAFGKADALVVHGDLITKASKEDELLPENERGKRILHYLSKPKIVFARTTPAQKLIIVKACQEQGHIVAVTGDGVNDSPAIKKADIGIAMGITGSDVAKDAADMVLLTDDFAGIVIGIEEGRRVFDNLKKAIVYVLTSNIPELVPFLTLIILGIPLPLSTVLILCIDLGTDLIPNIAFGSEEAEIDIMVRPCRKKYEHMVTSKVLCISYAVVGPMEAFAGYLTYFTVMYDFGLMPTEMMGMGVETVILPEKFDVYDPNSPYMGHTSEKFKSYCDQCWSGGSCSQSGGDLPDWLYLNDKTLDLRLVYLQCTFENGVKGFKHYGKFDGCRVKQMSHESDLPVCFTTEMLKFAQTSFFFAIVITQYSNYLSCKTRKTNFYLSGARNYFMNFGFAFETLLTFALAYLPIFNSGLGSRPLILAHYGFAAVPFSIFILVFGEVRKWLARNVKRKERGVPNWFERNTFW